MNRRKLDNHPKDSLRNEKMVYSGRIHYYAVIINTKMGAKRNRRILRDAAIIRSFVSFIRALRGLAG